MPLRPSLLACALLGSIALLVCRPLAAQDEPVRWRAVLDQPAAWYGTEEAVRIAENVLRYQRDVGGWPKNIDMAVPLAPAEQEALRREQSQADATIDNRATYTQLRFLAQVYAATGTPRFRAAFERGLDYLFAAQYDNGGWPQYYPIREGYYRHITYNDHAMIGVMRLLRDIARGDAPFGFVDADRRRRAETAVAKGLDVILATQIRVDGRLTAWCAQHDEVTLAPRPARTYELASLSGSESVEIVRYLMEIERPSPDVVAAVHAAVAWFEEAKLTGLRLEQQPAPGTPRGTDRVVVEDPDAPPLWARFYEIGTNKPIFSSRDGVPRARLADISYERRNGYSWLGAYAEDLLAREYPAWVKRMAQAGG